MTGLSTEARRPTQGGLRNHRVEFIRENEQGVPNENPEWNLYSDTMQSLYGWAPDSSVEGGRGVTDVDPTDFYAGPESHEATFTYWLQNFFVDESGEPLDASYDGMFRTPNGLLPNTHTVVDREWHAKGGADGAGFYAYVVGTGGHPSTTENEGDASTGQPMPITLEYTFERVRPYVIHQPSTETELVVSSTDAADTGQQVTVESEGGGTSGSATLDGTTVVSVTGPFSSIDAVRLDGETVGDVEVAINDGDSTSPTKGTVLATIHGKSHYSPEGSAHLEGDLGVPLLGDGSHASAIDTGYEYFLGSSIERSGGQADIGPRVNSANFSVDQGIDTSESASTRVMAIDPGIRETTLEASVAGPKASHDAAQDHLAATQGDITWEFSSGSLVFPGAAVTEPGEYVAESEQAALYVDDTFSSSGVEVNSGGA